MKDMVLMVVLLAGSFLRDNTAFLLSSATAMPAPGLYRVAGGLWEATLCGVVIWLLMDRRADVIRTLSIAACGVGIVNGLMSAGCRLGLPPPPYPQNVTQCDYLAGFPIGLYVLVAQFTIVAMIVVIWVVAEWRRWRSRAR